MKRKTLGLTDLYNLFHDPAKDEPELVGLRALQADMNMVVAAAYEWRELDLGYDFHETKQGVRFTISELARREVLARLLKLNHEHYDDENNRGLHAKKGKPKKPSGGRGPKKSASSGGPKLFNEGDEEDPSVC